MEAFRSSGPCGASVDVGLFKHLQGLPEKRILYAPRSEKLFEWIRVQHLVFPASVLRLASGTLREKTAHPL